MIRDDEFVTANIIFNMKHLKNASYELYIPSQFQIQGNTSPVISGEMGTIKARNLRMERIGGEGKNSYFSLYSSTNQCLSP